MWRMCHLIFRLLFLLDGGVWSLRNLSISVPRAVLSGESQSVNLSCSYDLEGAALYSIRWYFAAKEFYRFVPRELPPTKVFPLPGASVDLSQSDAHQVRVVGMNRQLSGQYECEVSADAPLFHTAILNTHLTVVDQPAGPPRVSSTRGSYSRGDVLSANCSVDASYPPANITWLVDGHKVAESTSQYDSTSDYLERPSFSHIEISVLESDHYKVGLTYTSASLTRIYEPHVYDREVTSHDPDVLRYSMPPPTNGHFTLTCLASIFDVYARRSDSVVLREDSPRPASVTRDDSSGTISSKNIYIAMYNLVFVIIINLL